NTTVEPCGATIPEPGVAHVSVTSGVVMTTSALTGKNPLSAITSKGFAEPTAATRLASSVTVTYDASVSEGEGGAGQAAGPLTANDAPTRAASPVGSRHPTTKLMAARAAGRQAIRIAHLRVHEEWHVSIGTVSRRSEEHTSELQSRFDLVCRLLLEKKKKKIK